MADDRQLPGRVLRKTPVRRYRQPPVFRPQSRAAWWSLGAVLSVFALILGALVTTPFSASADRGASDPTAEDRPSLGTKPSSEVKKSKKKAGKRTLSSATATAINTDFQGLTTFRGNANRTYYGSGPVPTNPTVLWRYPESGSLCSRSTDEDGESTWCGVGWTGQPNVLVGRKGKIEVRFGALDGQYHFVNGRTGKQKRKPLRTGDLAKGSATSDPDGYPLYYAGSRDNLLRVIALDRGKPTVLWKLDSRRSVPKWVWNDDWDGAPLVIGDYLLAGSENSWFYVIKLNRSYGVRGKVQVAPRVVVRAKGWDDRLLRAIGDDRVSIETSVSFREGVAYFANSGGLVQGWDVSGVLDGGSHAKRVFRFWTGDDTDASVVVDEKGFLYVASQVERFTKRSGQLGQLMKLDPSKKRKPLVWSIPLDKPGLWGKAGAWSTPALHGKMVYVATHGGELIGVSRGTGKIRWRIELPGPVWGSPAVVDDVLVIGDCRGAVHAFDVSKQGKTPTELWQLKLDNACIDATPAIFGGTIWIGTRGGALYAIGDKK